SDTVDTILEVAGSRRTTRLGSVVLTHSACPLAATAVGRPPKEIGVTRRVRASTRQKVPSSHTTQRSRPATAMEIGPPAVGNVMEAVAALVVGSMRSTCALLLKKSPATHTAPRPNVI